MQRFVAVLIIVFWCFVFAQPGNAAVNPFPRYASIEANVDFWKKVYAEYPSTQGFIHDGEDLSVIYAIIDLKPRDKPGSSKSNRRKVKAAKEKYRQLLRKLAKGDASSKEAKRIAKLFGSKASPARFRQAAKKVRFQLCQKDRFRKGLIRSGRYLVEIKKIFRDNSLPVDLAYLPHVESSFNYEAYSKFGAAGIWQFIRSTGRRFMTISYTLDERRDPIVASHAAAKYLKQNYKKLGSWPLALTAYNHGAGSMKRAKKRHGGYEAIYNHYENKRFGFASKNFYAEFLAAREVAKNYKKYFKGLVFDKPVKVTELKMKGYVDVDDIVDFFEVDLSTLRSLNPALRKPVFAGQKYVPKGYKLRLPVNVSQGQRTAELPSAMYKKNQKRSRFYRVARGDTAGKIARMHRVSLRDLIDSNQLDRRARIYVGQNLRIPVPGEKKTVVVAKRAKDVENSSSKDKISRKNTRKKPKKLAVTPEIAKDKKIKRQPVVVSPPKVLPPAPEVVAIKKKKVEAEPVKDIIPVKPVVAETVKPVAPPVAVTLPEPPPPPVVVAVPPEKQLAMVRVHKAPTTNEAGQIPLQGTHGNSAEMEIGEGSPAIEEPPQGFALLNTAVVLGNFGVLKMVEKGDLKVGVVQVEYMETLGHYGDWLEIPTQKIRDLNNLSFRKQITAHKKIKIPFGKVSKELFVERRYEFHKEVEEDFFAAYEVVAVQNYAVKKGDNIWSLVHDDFQLPFWLVQKFNPNLDFDTLQLGQKLTVPVVEDR